MFAITFPLFYKFCFTNVNNVWIKQLPSPLTPSSQKQNACLCDCWNLVPSDNFVMLNVLAAFKIRFSRIFGGLETHTLQQHIIGKLGLNKPPPSYIVSWIHIVWPWLEFSVADGCPHPGYESCLVNRLLELLPLSTGRQHFTFHFYNLGWVHKNWNFYFLLVDRRKELLRLRQIIDIVFPTEIVFAKPIGSIFEIGFCVSQRSKKKQTAQT